MRRYRNELLASAALVVMTLAAFWPVLSCHFVNYDDPDYVTENRHVKEGLTRNGMRWALTTVHASNWHPLTWISLQLDATLFGVDARAFHRTNLLLHAASALLLLGAFRSMTGDLWRSFFAAALFALHPLHVESVAWVAERKDVLSTLFWMLTLAAYAFYVRRPGVLRYLAVVAMFVCGLAAKPMLVTLPFVLLLLDYWPLQRKAQGWLSLGLEKAPLFAIVAASCVVTLIAQRRAVSSLHTLSISDRVLNALAAYVGYLSQTFFPRNLCVLYQHPGNTLPVWQAVLAGAILLLISIGVFLGARRHPYLPVGWLWYLGTMVPVIGLVQVGEQAMADRYTYVPLIGIFLAIAWGLPACLEAMRLRPVALVFPAALLLLACGMVTRTQVRYWRDSRSLWEHALAVDPSNPTAHNNFGVVLLDEGKPDEAMEHFVTALRLRGGDYAKASNNLGMLLMRQGKLEEAIDHFHRALRSRPEQAVTHRNLGLARCQQGRYDEAVDSFQTAVNLKPESAADRFHLGYALKRRKSDDARAADEYREGMRLDPGWVEAINRSAWVMATHRSPAIRNGAEAMILAQEACDATEDSRPEYLDTLAAAQAETGDFYAAIATADRAVELAGGESDVARRIGSRLRGYKRNEAYRE